MINGHTLECFVDRRKTSSSHTGLIVDELRNLFTFRSDADSGNHAAHSGDITGVARGSLVGAIACSIAADDKPLLEWVQEISRPAKGAVRTGGGRHSEKFAEQRLTLQAMRLWNTGPVVRCVSRQ